MLARRDQQLSDSAGDGCVDVGLHLHGFEGEQFGAALDGMVGLHGDAGNYAGGRRWNLPGIGGVGFGVSALDYAQCAIANVDFAGLTVELEEERAGAVGMRVDLTMSVLPCSISMVISSPDFRP